MVIVKHVKATIKSLITVFGDIVLRRQKDRKLDTVVTYSYINWWKTLPHQRRVFFRK